MVSRDLKEGLVIRVAGGEVWGDIEGEFIACVLRGRLRKSGRGIQIAAGDRVLAGPNLSRLSAGTPIVETVAHVDR